MNARDSSNVYISGNTTFSGNWAMLLYGGGMSADSSNVLGIPLSVVTLLAGMVEE